MKTTNLTTWHSAVGEYLVTYVITQNQNTCYEEGTLYEYGIECFLNKGNTQVSFASVDCVSPDYERVFRLVQTLKKFQVFPAHLKEIICDLMNCEEQEISRMMCA